MLKMENYQISCQNCGKPYPEKGTPYKCECGGVFDFSKFPAVSAIHFEKSHKGMDLFHSSLGLDDSMPLITLGEGNTPLLQGIFNHHPIYYKLEGQNPTGSYKDRGSAVLVSFLKARGVTSCVEDSSGNAGASLAAYCARAGIDLQVFIPESASGPKSWQIEMYGAHVARIPGPRSKAAEAVLNEVQNGHVYASHAYMPFGLAGIATIAYEIVATLGKEPGTVISPVGHGGLLYGIMLGFEALQAAGLIKRVPYYLGVQARNCNPVVEAYSRHSTVIEPIEAKPTLAEGASVTQPVRAGQILKRVLNGGGKLTDASEPAIQQAYRLVAKQGIFYEPTACLSLTPLLDDKIELPEPIVVILTGMGIKTNPYSI